MTISEQVASVRRALVRRLTPRLLARTPRPFLHLRALRALARGEAVTQAELAQRLLLDAASVSRMVDRLEAEGLVKRQAGEDRRSVRLAVTPRSKGALGALAKELAILEKEIRRHLSAAEARALKSLLAKVELGLSAELPRRASPRRPARALRSR